MSKFSDLAVDVVHYATSRGLLRLDNDDHAVPPPFSLFPSPFPRSERDFAASIQKGVSQLMDGASRDRDFLRKALENVATSDEFTRKLLTILDETWESSQKKPTLLLLRSDYLLDASDGGRETRLRQIEVNVIAASCSYFARLLPHVHRFSLSLRDGTIPFAYKDTVPDHSSNDGFINALALSWKTYGAPNSIVVILIEQNARNLYEISSIGYGLLDHHGIKAKLIQFDDVIEGGSFEAKLQDDKKLVIDGNEVAVVFYRTCYGIEHYPTEKHWKARLLLEASKSIQCPSVAQQLAGSKKVQQELSMPGQVEKYIDDATAASRMRATFCAMKALDKNAEGDAAALLGIQNPDNYVLKPQREGGGHNVYGKDVKAFLEKYQNSDERGTYIMMERVRPRFSDNCIVKPKEIVPVQLINELGIFGVYVRKGKDVLLNEVAGHCLRSKPFNSDEGGIFAGYGCIDSPLFT